MIFSYKKNNQAIKQLITYKPLLLLGLSLFLSITAFAQKNTVHLGELYYYYQINSILAHHVDSSNELTIKEIPDQPFITERLSGKASVTNTYWFRFKIKDTLDFEVDYEISLNEIDYISLYQPIKNGGFKTTKFGLLEPAVPDGKYYDSRRAIINSIDLDTSRYCYIKIKNFSRKGNLATKYWIGLRPVMLYHDKSIGYKKRDAKEFRYVIFLGLLLGLFLYFFVTYFFNKSTSFLLYSLYLLSLFIYFFSRLHIVGHFWRETYPIMIIICNDISMILSSTLYTAFVSSYLDFRNNYSTLYPWIKGYLYCMYSVAIIYTYFLVFDRFNPIHVNIIDYEFIIMTLAGIIVLVYVIVKGLKGAAAWIVVIGSLLLIAGNASSMLGGNFMNIVPFITVEVLLFAVGLGYQIRLNDLERLKTKSALIKQLQLNDKLQKNMQSKLEEEVKKQTETAIEMAKAAEMAKAEKRHTELLSELEQAKMKALQAQMNPHFIFNCLNSIRLYYMSEDLEKADDYITKFSRLIRSILNYSRMKNISLKEELGTLQLYMEFEQMRYKGKFDFIIDVDENINLANIRIQSMLLQPFVENAIWHGLMMSEHQGLVKIQIKPYDTSSSREKLIIIIEDNGIGRKKSKQFKKDNVSKRKSHGLQITKERLDLLKRTENKEAMFEIIDLYNDQNQAIGTKVHIIYDL